MTAFDALTALEETLLRASRQLADTLALPPDEARTGAIRAQSSQLFRHRATYGQAVQTLQGFAREDARDTPDQAARRRGHLRHAATRVQIWGTVEKMVARQTWPSSFRPLFSEKNEFQKTHAIGMVNQVMQALFDLSNPTAAADARATDESFADIPLSGAHFIELLTTAQRLLLAQGRTGPFSFLDMGCGAGSKVLTALGAFEVAHGIDFNPAYVKAGRAFLTQTKQDPDLISAGDALTFDRYGDYDVIYFYRPLKRPDLARQMEARVLEQAKPGAVIVAPLNLTVGRGTDGAARVEDPIYLAATSRPDAIALADRAANIGSERRPGVTIDAEALGFWAPIVAQSQRNGFAML